MRVVIAPTAPEVAERYPLTLKWRRTHQDDSHFTARDPENSRNVEVTMFSVNLDSAHMNVVDWSWRCSMHAIFHLSVIEQLGKSCMGHAQNPRIAAWNAEQAYRRYLEIVPKDVHANEISHREWRTETLERIYKEGGLTI